MFKFFGKKQHKHRKQTQKTNTVFGKIKQQVVCLFLTSIIKLFFIFLFLGIAVLPENHRRELQRRSDASVDHASSLPPGVVSVLTQCDALEKQREELNTSVHNKLVDVIERFFKKLDGEEKKYRTRMEELEVPKSFKFFIF